jgi:NADH-quinone oxidoreductase subunit F
LKPPFPAQVGAFGCPTTVNNLETIAIVPTAIQMGGEAFSKLSSLHHLNDGGTRLYGINGHVNKPGVHELAVGVTLRELIEDLGGGVLGGKKLLAVIPGGSSTPVIRFDDVVDAPDEKSPLHPWHGKSVLDVPLGVETMRGVGSSLGTCCITVMAEGTCMVSAMHNLMQFYKHESCGQCTPCREGSGWLLRTVERIIEGRGAMEDIDNLADIANNIMGNTICAFGEGNAMPALGFLKKFRGDFEAYVQGQKTQAKDARLTV